MKFKLFFFEGKTSFGKLHISIYDKRDDVNFDITNFPFLSSNIPASPAYGVFISQLIRYARAYTSYGCFILRATRFSNKLLKQKFIHQGAFEIVIEEVSWSIRGYFRTICSSSLTNAKWHSVAWPNTMTTLYRSYLLTVCDLFTELDLLLAYDRSP